MTQRRFRNYLASSLLVAASIVAHAQAAPPTMTLVVDETQAARRIVFVHEEIPAKPGAITLVYPRWIPGEHGPTGPIQEVVALRVQAGGATLPWTRDPDDIYNFQIDVPKGADKISVDFDTPLQSTISDHQFLLAWSANVLYPLNADKKVLMVTPLIILPAGWKTGASLTVASQSGNRVNFAPLSLERLIDSPVLAGEFFRAVPLDSHWPAELDVTGDSQSAIDHVDDAHAVTLFGKLVDEDEAMFGFRHWKTFHILVSQSKAMPFDGLEHEDSPWNAVTDAGLSKKDELEKVGWPLLAHEQSHSWDGKYRRPAELYSKPNYQGPERATLLWVYEGLNEYIGMLLATRAGFNDEAYARDYYAQSAAEFSIETGRSTTPLVDTATENWVLRSLPLLGDWEPLRRTQDYYDEGALIWMRADVMIREQSHGKASLDDFLRKFLGQRDTDPIVNPYTRADVEATLNEVWPYDWHSFFESRIYQVNSKPPVDGLEAAGWRLVYNETPSPATFMDELTPLDNHAEFSLGMTVKKDGTIFDVWPGTPAYDAGLGPEMTIMAVDGRPYSGDVLNESIAHPPNGKISLVVRNFETVATYELQYAGGVRHPHLERIPGSHDYLSDIFAPRASKHQ